VVKYSLLPTVTSSLLGSLFVLQSAADSKWLHIASPVIVHSFVSLQTLRLHFKLQLCCSLQVYTVYRRHLSLGMPRAKPNRILYASPFLY